jgi:hypothetical protein
MTCSPTSSPDRAAGTLQVHSARVAYRGPDRLDVTRKTGGPEGLPFAPSWAILRPALDARARAKALPPEAAAEVERAAWEAYVPAYLREMRASYRRHRATWDALLARPRVVLVCYCVFRAHCHTSLLRADILPACGAVDAGEL